MKRLYVKRDGSNKVVTVFHKKQFDGQEALDETHPDLIAFRNPPPPTKVERVTAITGGSDLNKVMFKMFFRLANDVRALEGKQPLTVNQFLTFLEGELE